MKAPTVHLYQYRPGAGKVAVCPTNTTREHTTTEVAKVTCRTCRAWLKRRGLIRELAR